MNYVVRIRAMSRIARIRHGELLYGGTDDETHCGGTIR